MGSKDKEKYLLLALELGFMAGVMVAYALDYIDEKMFLELMKRGVIGEREGEERGKG